MRLGVAWARAQPRAAALPAPPIPAYAGSWRSVLCSAASTIRKSWRHSSLNSAAITAAWPAARLRLCPGRSARCMATRAISSEDIGAEVGLLVEGEPALSDAELDELSEGLYQDARRIVQEVALYLLAEQGEADRQEPPGPMELSVVLCDDAYITELNKQWRGKDAATDVLSFEMGEDDADDSMPELPVAVLGDVVVSLDTAARQAAERGYGLRDECRVLLVHGVLHLFGFDHELGDAEADEMAAAEAHVLSKLGWQGQGLIEAAAAGGKESLHDGEAAGAAAAAEGGSNGSSSAGAKQGRGV